MTLTFRTLFLLVLSALLFISCGRSGDEMSDPTPETKTPETANEREVEKEEDGNRDIRYSSVVLEENCGFWSDCDFIIRSDFNRRPVLLTADFSDNGVPTEEPTDEGMCTFQITLSEGEADQLEAYADRLRFCEVKNTPTADRGFNGLFATDISGIDSMVYKYKDGGQEEEENIKYLCRGRAEFYNYMAKLIVPRAPKNCPSGFKRLFR